MERKDRTSISVTLLPTEVGKPAPKEVQARKCRLGITHPAFKETEVHVIAQLPATIKSFLYVCYEESDLKCNKETHKPRFTISNVNHNPACSRMELDVTFACKSACFLRKPPILHVHLESGNTISERAMWAIPFRDRSKIKSANKNVASTTAPPPLSALVSAPIPNSPTVLRVSTVSAPRLATVSVSSPRDLPTQDVGRVNFNMQLIELDPSQGHSSGGYYICATGNFDMISPLNQEIAFYLRSSCTAGDHLLKALISKDVAFLRMPGHDPGEVQICATWNNEPLRDICSFRYTETHITRNGLLRSIPSDKFGYNAAHIAAACDEKETLETLEQKLFSQTDNWGRVPLTYAIIYDATESIEYLTKNSDSANIRDMYGLLPRQYYKYRSFFMQQFIEDELEDKLIEVDPQEEIMEDSDTQDSDMPDEDSNTPDEGIRLPIELTHTRVKFNGDFARVKLLCVDAKQSVCEFLNGPDTGRISSSLSAASKRLCGANGNGWTDFTYNGAPLQQGGQRLKFNNDGAVLSDYLKSSELDDELLDHLAEYRSRPAHERLGEVTLSSGEHITGLARGKSRYSARSPPRVNTTTTTTTTALASPASSSSSSLSSTSPLLRTTPNKIVERVSLFHIDNNKRKNSEEETPTITAMTARLFNKTLDNSLLAYKLRRQQNLARKHSLLKALSAALQVDEKEITTQAMTKLYDVPEIKDLIEAELSEISEEVSLQQLPAEVRHKICILAISQSYGVKVVVHTINIETREYQTETIMCESAKNTNRVIHLAFRRIPHDHYDCVVSTASSEIETEQSAIMAEDNMDDMEVMDVAEDLAEAKIDETPLPHTLDLAIVQLFERISYNTRITMTYQQYQNAIEQVARNNQGVFDAMNKIGIDASIGKPNREKILLQMINEQFNKLLGGDFVYRSVARLVNNLTPPDSQKVMAAKLALGIVVAKRYLEKKAEGRIVSKPLNVLVAGFVQFGKTSNMLILSAILADRGFRYIILLSGKTIVLRNQSASRGWESFREPSVQQNDPYEKIPDTPQNEGSEESTDEPEIDEDFANFGNEKVSVIEIRKEDVKEDVGKRKLRNLVNSEQNMMVLVCKKNRDIIRNLTELLLVKGTTQDKIALIDDEGDDSVNTKDAGKEYTQLYQALLDLYSVCTERAVENFVYFAYTATTAACLIQHPSAKIAPDVLAFMLLNQPSYLGLEHFVSPDFLDMRVTRSSSAIDFLEEDSTAEKLRIVPLTFDFQLLRFVLKTYGARESKLKELGRYGVSNPFWQQDYNRVLKSMLSLLNSKYKNKYGHEDIEKIKKEIEKNPLSKDTRSRQKIWNSETVRVSEAQFHLANFSIPATPRWLLEFVFRSLLTWVIYNDRLKPSRTNNLYSAVRGFMSSENLLIGTLNLQTFQQNRVLNRHATEFLTDEEFKKIFTHDIFSSPYEQQRIFQWDDNDHPRSANILAFLAQFFGVNLRIIAKSGALLHESPAVNAKPFLTITCEKHTYTCSYEYVPVSITEDSVPQYSAFMHLSGRQIVHQNLLLLVRKILTALKAKVFWNEFKENKFIKFKPWAEALLQAYTDTVNLRNQYAQQEFLLNLSTLETKASRPAIPPLEVLIPMIQTVLDGVDSNNEPLCDVRVRMTRNFFDPDDPTNNLTIKDLIVSKDNKLPRYMFIVGGDCFTRGVTLPTPLTSLYLRFMDNQEALMQALRWCGHRQAEAVDLMNVMCGSLQVSQFQRLWANMSTNTIALIKHDLQYDGWLNRSQLRIIEEKGSRAAPKNKMWYGRVVEPKNSRIQVTNPPIKGSQCLEVFYETNKLFDMLVQQYKSECPGNPASAYNKNQAKTGLLYKSKPGILFRAVDLEHLLPILFAIQKEHKTTNFDALVDSLQHSTEPVNVCFLHKRNYDHFVQRLPMYMERLKGHIKANDKTPPHHDLLEYVSPLYVGREDKVFRLAENPPIQRMSVVDATMWKKMGTGENSKYSVLEAYQSYVNMSPDRSISRSQRAPPLLCIAILDPEFRSGRQESNPTLPSLVYHTDPAMFCDFPPVAFYLYPQYQPINLVLPQTKKVKRS